MVAQFVDVPLMYTTSGKPGEDLVIGRPDMTYLKWVLGLQRESDTATLKRLGWSKASHFVKQLRNCLLINQDFLEVLNNQDFYNFLTKTHKLSNATAATIVRIAEARLKQQKREYYTEFGVQPPSVFDVFVNKRGERQPGVTVSETADNCKTLSRYIYLDTVTDRKLTDEEITTIKTVYEIPADFEHNSTLITDKRASMIFNPPEKEHAASAEQPAKKARTQAKFVV